MKYMLLLGIDPAIERDKLVSEFTNAKRVALSGRERVKNLILTGKLTFSFKGLS